MLFWLHNETLSGSFIQEPLPTFFFFFFFKTQLLVVQDPTHSGGVSREAGRSTPDFLSPFFLDLSESESESEMKVKVKVKA